MLDDYVRYGNPLSKPGGREPAHRADISVVGDFHNTIDNTANSPAYELEDLDLFGLQEDEVEDNSDEDEIQKPTKGKKKPASKKSRSK